MNDTTNGAARPDTGTPSKADEKSLSRFISHFTSLVKGSPAGKLPAVPRGAAGHWTTLSKRVKTTQEPEQLIQALHQVLSEFPDHAEDMWDAMEQNGWKDPDRPPKPPRTPPSLADAKKLIKGLQWIWPDWILAGQLTLLTGASGSGKSTLMADLARRVYKGEPWPDGVPQVVEPGRPIMWLNSDRRMDQLAELWAANGLPDEACFLAHDISNPLNPFSLDDPSTMQLIAEYVEAVKPWALVIDTISRAMGQDLCSPNGVTEITGPLLELSNRTGIAIILLGHTNKDGQAYGRHLRTTCQVCWMLEGTSAISSRTLKNDDRCVSKPPEPIGATIQIDGSWKWGEVVNLDDGGRAVGCARLIMDLIQRNGRTGWNDLVSQCELGGNYDKGTVSKALKTLVEVGKLIRIDEESKRGKPYKLWELATPSESAVMGQSESAESESVF